MRRDTTWRCEGPDCPIHQSKGGDPDRQPVGWIVTDELDPDGHTKRDFCGWECLLRYAGQSEPPEWFDVDVIRPL